MVNNSEINYGPFPEFEDDDASDDELPLSEGAQQMFDEIMAELFRQKLQDVSLDKQILQDVLRAERNKPILATALDEVLDLINEGIPLDQIDVYISNYLAVRDIHNVYIGPTLFEDVSQDIIDQALAIREALGLLYQKKTEAEVSLIMDAKYESRFNLEIINMIVDKAISIFRGK